MNKMNEFIAALRRGKGYGWIADHGWELSKDELCDIIKEYEYARTEMNDDLAENLFKDYVIENLEDIYGEEC